MGIFNNKDDTTTTGVPVHHHAGTEGVVAGTLGHHHGEASGHGVRDGVLAGGAVGETQHLRNEHAAHQASSNQAGTTLGYGSGGAGSAGSGGLGASGLNTSGTAAAGGLTTGAAHTSGLGHNQPGEVPTLAQAEKLEKKGATQEKIGHALHLHSMEAKGANKVMEGQQLAAQAAELNQAQTLEQEAGARRDRAVGLGAGPEHGKAHHIL